MKAIATALLNLAAFVELAGDDVIDPDSSADALEQLGSDLDEASPEERKFLKKLIEKEIDRLPDDGEIDDRDPEDQARLNFYMELLDMLDA